MRTKSFSVTAQSYPIMIRSILRFLLCVSLAALGGVTAQVATPSPSPAATATPSSTQESADREQVNQEMVETDTPITESGKPKPDALANEVESEITTAEDSAPLETEGVQTEQALGAMDDVEGAVGDVTDTADPLPEAVPGDLGLGDDMDFLPTGEVSPSDIPDPNSLFPDDFSPGEMPPPPPAVAENEFERDRKLRIRFQEVKVQAGKDQAVRQMKEQADRATTEEEKRAALREHYRMLFAKMVSIDSELAERCVLMEAAYLRRIGQFRVEPTIPLTPPPTPEPLEAL